MDNVQRELIEVEEFLLDIATSLMGAGTHTSRVVRNVKRVAESYGYEVFITIFQKNITMNTRKKGSIESLTLIRPTKQMALNFTVISDLSALSWDIADNNLSLCEARARYADIMAKPRMSRWLVLFLVACANAAFCKLFAGDWIACGVVFVVTLIGFFIRQQMMERHMNHNIIFSVVAFVSSLLAGFALVYGWGSTPHTAMATSVLFLIPGVPLINSIKDLMEGHVLTGISRMVNATILIISISVGFMASLLLHGIEHFYYIDI